jgi:acetyl esterase
VPDGVVLAYPALHAELPPLTAEVRRSVRGRRRLGTFTPHSVRWIVRNYVGPAGQGGVTEAFPVEDTRDDFPPTLIVDSEIDTLRVSGTAFAAALRARHRDVTHLVEPGHLNKNGSKGQRRTLDRMTQWLRTNR